jgi:hypothetical protein
LEPAAKTLCGKSRTKNETHYGYSVAVSGDTIIVGAPRYGNGGSIYAYVRPAAQPPTWILQQIMSANDTNICDSLGVEVALSGNTLIASTNRGLYTGAGCTIQNGYSVYIFARSGTIWTKQQKLHDSGVDVTDVAIHGDTAVFGTSARGLNSAFGESAAFVFTRTGTSWAPREPLITADDATSDGAADVAVSATRSSSERRRTSLIEHQSGCDLPVIKARLYLNVPDAPACGFTLIPTSQAFASAGGKRSFTISANSPTAGG